MRHGDHLLDAHRLVAGVAASDWRGRGLSRRCLLSLRLRLDLSHQLFNQLLPSLIHLSHLRDTVVDRSIHACHFQLHLQRRLGAVWLWLVVLQIRENLAVQQLAALS